MQSLDVISVNIWQILISAANLVILCLLFKKFLWSPVKKAVKKREEEVNSKLTAAQSAKEEAEKSLAEYNGMLANAKDEADGIIKDATARAQARSEGIIEDANQKASGILRSAEKSAQLEYKKAHAQIKTEIVDVSTALAEKLIGRELKEEDHRDIIDSVIENIGEADAND